MLIVVTEDGIEVDASIADDNFVEMDDDVKMPASFAEKTMSNVI